jgi:hypothetical protein
MRISRLILLVPFALGGCLSYSGSPPPARETVVVPAAPGTAVVCSNGLAPPC